MTAPQPFPFSPATMEQRLYTAPTFEVFGTRIEQMMAEMGFSDFSYYNLAEIYGDGRHELITSLPEAFLDDYYRYEYHQHDVVLSYGRHNREPVFYSDLYESLTSGFANDFSRKNRDIRHFYLSHGIQDLYLIPIHGEAGCFMLALMHRFSETDLAAAGTPRGVDTGDQTQVLRIKQYKGHFYLKATVGKAEVNFLIDSGASDSVLRESDARHAGLDVAVLHYDDVVQTANGPVKMASLYLDSLICGPTTLPDMPMSVSQADMPHSVLGQSFLARFSGYEVTGDTMTLKL